MKAGDTREEGQGGPGQPESAQISLDMNQGGPTLSVLLEFSNALTPPRASKANF